MQMSLMPVVLLTGIGGLTLGFVLALFMRRK